MKQCRNCKETKQAADFSRDQTKKDMLSTECKACANRRLARIRDERKQQDIGNPLINQFLRAKDFSEIFVK